MNTLDERANEYVQGLGLDYGTWCITDLVHEYAQETGEVVPAGALASAMLRVVAAHYQDEIGNLSDDQDDYEISKYDGCRAALVDAEARLDDVHNAERGNWISRADARELMREWGIVPECRGCRRGHAALCAECQAAVLGPTLVASVAVTKRTAA